MVTLSADWLTEGIIDYEYKKYLLLAYLQQVDARFKESALYPEMAELVKHYQNAVTLKTNQELLAEQFPKDLKEADFQNLKLVYESTVGIPKEIGEILQILDFSIPEFKKYLEEGKSIYQWAESQIAIQPLGIYAIDQREGFVLVRREPETKTRIYQYRITLFEQHNENFRGLNLEYLDAVEKSLFVSYEGLKLEVLKKYGNRSLSATYLVESKACLPWESTLMPVAKRSLIRYLNQTG